MQRLSNDLTEQLKIQYPIIQAPMAGGITTNELVTAASIHGTLGMIGAGYMTPFKLEKQILEIKQQAISSPVGINVFVPQRYHADETEIQHAKQLLKGYYQHYDIDEAGIPVILFDDRYNQYERQIEVIVRHQVPVCSFTFGIPSKEVIKELKKQGILLIGSATTVEEAREIEEYQLDMVVVQGSEAGGHRSAFLKNERDSLVGLMSLIPQVVDHVNIPVIAAGGIMDGRGLIASLALGAKAVQMGTAFLLTEESGAHPLHKDTIINETESNTRLTAAFSGKLARGIQNEFIRNLVNDESALPPFPIQNQLTQPIRKAGKKASDKEWMSIWSGQSVRLGKLQSVETLVQGVVDEAIRILEN